MSVVCTAELVEDLPRSYYCASHSALVESLVKAAQKQPFSGMTFFLSVVLLRFEI